MKLTFFAKVLPERYALTAPEVRYTAETYQLGFSYKALLSIHASQAIAQITFEASNPDFDTVKNIVEGDIRSFVDYYGFMHGVRFDVDVVTMVDENQFWRVFGIQIPVLSQSLQEQRDDFLKKYFLLALSRVDCTIVMADFREAMRNPPQTGFHCYRATEAMMQAMKANTEEDDRDAWERFRNNLRIDRTCLDSIKAHADPPRHGRPHAMTDAERAEVFRTTQRIVLRFLEYLTRSEKALPESEFPVLRA